MASQRSTTATPGLDGQLGQALVRTARFFRRGEVSLDLRTLHRVGGRQADAFYRDRWSYDKVVRSTHGVNCTGSCSWNVHGLVILLGAAATVGNMVTGGYDHRLTDAPWFRSIFHLDPRTSLIAKAPFVYQAHAFSAWLLFAFWPFTRLLHVFSAPVGCLTRPCVVYRTGGPKAPVEGAMPGSEPVGSARRQRP